MTGTGASAGDLVAREEPTSWAPSFKKADRESSRRRGGAVAEVSFPWAAALILYVI